MNFSTLPENSPLVLLLKNCPTNHELVLSECDDGAFLMVCDLCPFRYILAPEEEKNFRQQDFEKERNDQLIDEVLKRV